MLKQKSPNTFSCLPTSFACVLDIPVADLVKEIGHDGSKVIHPDQVGKYSVTGFHVQEFILPCHRRKLASVTIEATPVIQYINGTMLPLESQLIDEFIALYKGVLIGQTASGNQHALAWDKVAFDTTTEQEYNVATFLIREFIALIPME